MAPYVATLGVEFNQIAAQAVVARLPEDQSLSTVGGGLHGGAIMGLADVCAAVFASANGPHGAIPVTVDSTTHFVQALRGDAEASATAVAVGPRRVVVQVTVSDANGELCAVVVQTVLMRTAA